MKQNLRIAILMTLVTTVLFGLLYPFIVTGLGQLFFPAQANGGLIVRGGQIVGSHLIGQPFSSAGYFRSRRPQPAAVMTRLPQAVRISPTNHQLMDRIKSDVEGLHARIRVRPSCDLVTAQAPSGSRHISRRRRISDSPDRTRTWHGRSRGSRTRCQTHMGRQFGLWRASRQCS